MSEWQRAQEMFDDTRRAVLSARRSTEKGNCYQYAFEFADRAPQELSVVVVHGAPVLCSANELKGLRMGHAWCEVKVGRLDAVIDATAWLLVPRNLYYALGKLDGGLVERYSLSEARERLLSTGVWGPWDEAFNGLLYAQEGE